jgi:uncharacterized YigZ family protein
MALLGMLIAVLLVMGMTGIGFIPLPVIKATTMHIPVILGAVLLGPGAGAVLGGAFGLCSIWANTITPGLLSFAFSPFMSTTGFPGMVKSVWIALGCRILFGWLAGWIWKLLKQLKVRDLEALPVTGAVATICHTLLVMGSIYILLAQQYADAKHNVYAYLLRENNVTRFSDDGEPHGTAGLPVLDVLRKEGVTDVAVVVTRYFGGILLGTGGLVRAYSQAAKMALDAAGKSTMEKLLVFSLRVNYSDLQKIEPILENYTMIRLDTAYADDVRLSAAMREGEYPALEKALTERTNGRAILKLEGEQFACL